MLVNHTVHLSLKMSLAAVLGTVYVLQITVVVSVFHCACS